MSALRLLEIILAALWFTGSALATGMVISSRDKRDPKSRLLFLFALLFSWTYVGWATSELLRIIFKAIYTSRLPAQAGPRP
jgi:hypothetical protein